MSSVHALPRRPVSLRSNLRSSSSVVSIVSVVSACKKQKAIYIITVARVPKGTFETHPSSHRTHPLLPSQIQPSSHDRQTAERGKVLATQQPKEKKNGKSKSWETRTRRTMRPSRPHHHRLKTTQAPRNCNPNTIETTASLPRLAPASTTSAVPHLAFAVVGKLSPSATSVVQKPPCWMIVVVGLSLPTTTAPPAPAPPLSSGCCVG